MNIEDIKLNKPQGSTYYFKHDGKVFYFFISSYGPRQIKGNVIDFKPTGLDESDLISLI